VNGIHDMGGMHGFGSVVREEDEPVFHAPWEGRVYAINLCTPMPGGLRAEIESIPPADYLRYSYYEKWLHAKTEGLIKAGVIEREALQAREAAIARSPEAAGKPVHDQARASERLRQIQIRAPKDIEPGSPPRYRCGDMVLARNINSPGHTRLPRYIRGHRGRVERLWGCYRLEDQDPPGVMTERGEHVYSVRFEAAELWGGQAEPNQAVYIDMWESHMQAAD
jgi:nitrile hydratase subunit beta